MAFRLFDYISAPLEIIKLRNKWKTLQNHNYTSIEDKKNALNSYTLERLQFICSYANVHVPFYRNLFKKNNFDNNKDITIYNEIYFITNTHHNQLYNFVP